MICGLDLKISLLLMLMNDDATLLAVVPSPDMRPSVSESLNRDLAKINGVNGGA